MLFDGSGTENLLDGCKMSTLPEGKGRACRQSDTVGMRHRSFSGSEQCSNDANDVQYGISLGSRQVYVLELDENKEAYLGSIGIPVNPEAGRNASTYMVLNSSSRLFV